MVDEQAGAAALLSDTSRVAGVALDVLEQEPPQVEEHPLLRAAQEGANAIVTPHSAFFSEEAYVEMRHSACAEVLRVLAGERPWYKVN